MKWSIAGLAVALVLQVAALASASAAVIPGACNIAEPSTTSKECEAADKSVTIGAGAVKTDCQRRVALSVKGAASLNVGHITINTGGTLELHDEIFNGAESDIDLTTIGIDINGGSLLIGDATCPIGTIKQAANVTVTFTGEKPTTCGALDQSNPTCAGDVKGIQVEGASKSPGTLRMYGLTGVPPAGVDWTYLSQPAGDPLTFSAKNGVLAPPKPAKKGGVDYAKIIYTAARIDTGAGAWRAGDWIAVATTSFSPWETEFVRIQSVGPDTDNPGATGSKVTLMESLSYYHFGGADPGDPATDANYTAGATTNYGVDERAEVGLISRNIILSSDDNQNNQHWGGELKFLKGFKAVSLQGVELQKFGKEQLGSYPIHFHLDGDLSGYAAADILIDSNSIDHSYNKCITVHSTQNATYSNNVCARITGHIFYEEVGDEATPPSEATSA